jgi:nitroreductase
MPYDIHGLPPALEQTLVLHEQTKLSAGSAPGFQRRVAAFNRLSSQVQLFQRGDAVERYVAGRRGRTMAPVTMTVNEALQRRQSRRQLSGGQKAHLPVSDLEAVLDLALGTHHVAEEQERPVGARSYPSAGALYPIEHHLLMHDEPGRMIHRIFAPFSGHLIPGHGMCTAAEASDATGIGGVVLAAADALVVQVARFLPIIEKYGARGYRFVLIEAGMAAEALSLAAEARGFGTCSWGGFHDDQLAHLLRLDLPTSQAVNLITIGRIEPSKLSTTTGTEEVR